MLLRIVLNCAVLLAALLVGPPLAAQDHPAKRLSSIVGVAVEEYGKAFDERGRLVADLEYQEAVDFLKDAVGVAQRLSGERAEETRRILDSLVVAVDARRPPAEVRTLHGRFAESLGAAGALEMPTRPVDVAAGRALYEKNCASCHGERGLGDGPAAAGMVPAPPAVGSATDMLDASPALMYRILAVGIAGTPMAGWADALTAEQRWDIIAYLTTLRGSAAQVSQGEGLYVQRCSACHGLSGSADGVAAAALTRLPPEIGSFAWQAERSDAQLMAVVRDGMAGTAMPAARDLTPDELASVVAYVRALSLRPQAVTAARRDSADAAAAARAVMALVDRALTAARAGRTSDAADDAFDAYIAFEPLERTTRAKNPGLIASVEKLFGDFKAALRAGDVRSAERARNAIETALPAVVELTKPATSAWSAFLQSFLIILREGVEAILVIGAIVTFLIKTGHRARLRAIWVGTGLALVASAITAVVLQTALRAMPATREIIEGATMLVAVAVLFSVSYWLVSKVEAAKWQKFIREKVSTALEHGGGRTLALVAFLAVYREGAETALFYQALFHEGDGLMTPLLLGILVGALALAVIFTLFYRFGVRIPLRPFFAVTSGLLYYMAFVFAGKGIRELQEGNALPTTALPGFPHVEALGIFPYVETLLAQLVLLLLLVFALLKTFWPTRSVALPTVPVEAPKLPDVAGQLARLEDQTSRLQARVSALEDAVGDAQGATRDA